MFSRIAVVALALVASVEANVINKDTEIRADSVTARNLMNKARAVQEGEQNYDYNQDGSFLGGYSLIFQGCHHVQQWNENAQDEDDVKIMTERLVRFRLCPSSDCNNDLTGCSSNYGDYVVDMETFLNAYGNQQYQNQGGEGQEQGGQNGGSYTECTKVNMRRDLQEGEQNQYYNNGDSGEYYVGPYCADQGGEIKLGVFQDDTCSVFATNGETMYTAATGQYLSSSSLVSTSCMSCGYGGLCNDIYDYAGKCETKMQTNWPNEASCSYIEGIKIIREDGVIRTAATKKSKAAAIAIGVFLTLAVLLAGYVYYLRTKLSRAKINLNAGTQSLA